ncbi:MAG TPA: fibronectin type III domain-containing protein [Candidatus Nanoarchaeia archaeon]|nr:fibronectin type III domain-containing protein [Candidatus Nanoarchaeia archaeon]
MSKKMFMATIIITAFLVSLVTGMQAVEMAKAGDTIPAPSVPELTVKLVKGSYSITNTSTGATQQILNNSIELIIRNQPLPAGYSNLTICYQLRVKSHETENWAESHSGDLLQSNSDYTILDNPQLPFYPTIYFQVQAQIGIFSQTYNPDLQILPGFPKGGIETSFDPLASSEWSNTAMVNLTDGSVFVSPPFIPTVSLTAQTDRSITLSWTRLDTSVFGMLVSYQVTYASSINGPYSIAATIDDSNQTSYTLTGLTPDIIHYFVIRYVGTNVVGSNLGVSNTLEASTITTPTSEPSQTPSPTPLKTRPSSLFPIVVIVAVLVIIVIGVAGYVDFKKKRPNKKGNFN